MGIPELASLTRPVTMAEEQVLPVAPSLEHLLPEGGLRRGTTIAAGSTSLALALLARASATGSWCAAVGIPHLGMRAAYETGMVLERFALIPHPGSQWASIVAALIDGVDAVLLQGPKHVSRRDAERLTARARERGAVLLLLGSGSWAAPLHLRLSVAAQEWHGLGTGHGHLTARRMEIVVDGRGAARRMRRTWLWLPNAEGRFTIDPSVTAAVV